MSRTWAYLTKPEHKEYIKKAESLGISEGELTQKLIKMYLHTKENHDKPNCLECNYYQIATSGVMERLQKLNKLFF
jgi:hypothetical protein